MNRPRSSSPGQRDGPPGPPVDLVREGDVLVLTIWLPGLRAEDFRVTLSGTRQVSIEGTVPYRLPVPKEQLALTERNYGSFSRSLQLPVPVEAAEAVIRFERGVFTARLPVKAQRIALRW